VSCSAVMMRYSLYNCQGPHGPSHLAQVWLVVVLFGCTSDASVVRMNEEIANLA
jgi:hypothetical protein